MSESLLAKSPAETRVVMSQFMLPQDTNPAGHIHGGVILKYIDTAAAMVAMRHAHGNAVTASIDRVDFIMPVYVGELAHFKACLNWVGRSSMVVGVRVEGENLFTGERRHTASAYLTFVALDGNGKPCPIPSIRLETETDKRRFDEAATRQDVWKQHRQK